MTTESLNLQAREISGIKVDSPPVLCTTHDSFYFYLCENNTICTFDSKFLTNAKLPPYDSAIGPAKVTALALSPSHTLGVACFSNSSIQIYDLINNKPLKSNPLRSSSAITHCVFLNDATIICCDTNHVLVAYSLTFLKTLSFMRKAIQESFSLKLDGTVKAMIVPPIARPPESLMNMKINAESKKITQNFNDFICISTEQSFSITRINEKIVDKKEDILKFDVKGAVASFSLQNSNTLLCAYAAPCDISLIKITPTEYSANRISDAIDQIPVHIAFITDNSLAIVFSENSCLITSITEMQGCHTSIPVNGLYIDGYNSIVVFSPTKLYEVKMVTFEDKIEAFREKDDFQNAVNLCRKAMKNDQSASTGLPANESQKARVIERVLSPFLESRTEKRLKFEFQVEEQADYLMNLSKDLKMTDWIVSGALNLFNEANQLPLFFKKIIMTDPDAKFFNYNDNFVDLLLKEHGDLDITSFLLCLPTKVAPHKKLLEYGLNTKNSELLAKIYLKKLNDPVKCVSIYSHANNEQKIFEVLSEYISEDTQIHADNLIRWIFSSTGNNKLPHIRKIISNNQTDLINQIQIYITKQSEKSGVTPPMTLNQFVNACIYATMLENIPDNSLIHQLMESYVLNMKASLTKMSIKYVLQRIFNDEEIDPKMKKSREALLLVVLDTKGLDPIILENLMPLCTTYKFSLARKQIQTALRRFDIMIKDAIVEDGGEGIFQFIQQQIDLVIREKDTEALQKIKKSLISNAPLLIAKDVQSYINLFITKFYDANEELLATLNDSKIKHYYLRALLNDERAAKMQLTQKDAESHILFLCKYFPHETRRFIKNRENVNVGTFLEICKSSNVLDACAVICNKIGETEKSFTYLNMYLEKQLYDYVNETNTNDSNNSSNNGNCKVDLQQAFTLVRDFLSKGKVNNISQYATMLIKCFVLPLCKTKDQPEKSNVLCDYLRKVCAIAADNMPFHDILRIVVVEFAPLKLGIMRQTLCGIINDYDYDIDTSKSLTVLFQQDEVKAQDKYIMLSIKGTAYDSVLCGVCHGLLNEGEDCVKLFECGHIFHDNCLKKQVCPICNPDERIDQDVERPTQQFNPGPIFKRLKRFEYGLKVKPANSLKFVPSKGDITITRR
ncbi:hypothetical protein TRFO_37762 [Tritrichomonas foetus]|uniref:RING-type domain-containing protein n=1 Tax=Tritrichomonas foetus TaxID=1144522 RepID=A0A1J4JA91_9EUKA|nr:hypothetical protein TRFO_37762 [Tritrichomonas foetus]|eukprot:OHS96094.1 hypothetical protein TRFO_37762 [Tritrichomonas foetus]